MKKVSYQKSIYKSIKQTKEYLLELSKHSKYKNDLEQLVINSLDIQAIKKTIYSYEALQLEILLLIKLKIKTLDSYDEIEEALVYMNILLPNHPMLASYKCELLRVLMKYKEKDIQLYCLLRHLIYKSQNKLEQVIELLSSNDDRQYHILAMQVYCLERRYQEAKVHVFSLPREDIYEYKDELLATKPIVYWKLLKKEKKEVYSFQLGGN